MKKLTLLLLVCMFHFNLFAQPLPRFDFSVETGLSQTHAHIDLVSPLEEYSHWRQGDLAFWTDHSKSGPLSWAYYTVNDLQILKHEDFYSQLTDKELTLNQWDLYITSPRDYYYRIKLDQDGLHMRNATGFNGLDLDNTKGNIIAGMSGGQNGWFAESESTSGAFNEYNTMGLYSPLDGTRGVAMSYFLDILGDGTIKGGVFADIMYADTIEAINLIADTLRVDFLSVNSIGFISENPTSFTHPENPDKEIRYATINGPESAVYERGTVKLNNGEAFIEFSDHFKLISNPETMTVNITPLEWDTYGVAVLEKMATGIWVKELKGGKGNFEIDWEVKCVRKGLENYQVIWDKEIKEMPTNNLKRTAQSLRKKVNPPSNISKEIIDTPSVITNRAQPKSRKCVTKESN